LYRLDQQSGNLFCWLVVSERRRQTEESPPPTTRQECSGRMISSIFILRILMWRLPPRLSRQSASPSARRKVRSFSDWSVSRRPQNCRHDRGRAALRGPRRAVRNQTGLQAPVVAALGKRPDRITPCRNKPQCRHDCRSVRPPSAVGTTVEERPFEGRVEPSGISWGFKPLWSPPPQCHPRRSNSFPHQGNSYRGVVRMSAGFQRFTDGKSLAL